MDFSFVCFANFSRIFFFFGASLEKKRIFDGFFSFVCFANLSRIFFFLALRLKKTDFRWIFLFSELRKLNVHRSSLIVHRSSLIVHHSSLITHRSIRGSDRNGNSYKNRPCYNILVKWQTQLPPSLERRRAIDAIFIAIGMDSAAT